MLFSFVDSKVDPLPARAALCAPQRRSLASLGHAVPRRLIGTLLGVVAGPWACTTATPTEDAQPGPPSGPAAPSEVGVQPTGSETQPPQPANPSGVTSSTPTSGATIPIPIEGTTGISSESGPTTVPTPTTVVDTTPVTPVADGGLAAFTCPPPPYAAAPVSAGATATAVVGVPPADEFASTTDTVILEGPVWADGVLYFSQINSGTPTFGRPNPLPDDRNDGGVVAEELDAGSATPPRPPPSRVLSVDSAGVVTVVVEDSGSNGLALDLLGRVISANHGVGAVTLLPLSTQTAMNIVTDYEGVRFNSPNDLTVGRDGTIYFTDPDYQAPVPAPQVETRAYRVPPGATAALPLVEGRRQPNGITLSPGGETLYVSASDGLVAYPVQSDGAIGTGQPFAEGVVRSSDGMAADCAGNLYTTSGQAVLIVDALGAEVGRISVPNVQSVTNVAFGGPERKTIYITTLGSGTRVGLFQVDGAIPGMPY